MFLLDNQVVREDWSKAKGIVTATLEKHGGRVLAARRWDERKLAYPIGRKNRATYLIAYFEIGGAAMPAMRRDFELNERVLRYQVLARETMPENEAELAAAEQAEGFAVPAPPPDDAPEPAPRRREEPPAEERAEVTVPDLETTEEEA
jgi:ribosomal protein S6